MKINPIALTIRAKKLGVLIRDARLATGQGIEECAQALGVTPAQFAGYEDGSRSPSLPELEVLAYYLGVPLDHFWGDKIISKTDKRKGRANLQQIMSLRQRIIGATIRKARLSAGLSLEALAEKTWSSAAQLESYEMGEAPIPMPDLEVISSVLDRPLREFLDSHGPIGAWATEQRAVQDFLALTPDLQSFVSKPINRPYLELAQRLSEMSVDKLRAVAEGILEITL